MTTKLERDFVDLDFVVLGGGDDELVLCPQPVFAIKIS